MDGIYRCNERTQYYGGGEDFKVRVQGSDRFRTRHSALFFAPLHPPDLIGSRSQGAPPLCPVLPPRNEPNREGRARRKLRGRDPSLLGRIDNRRVAQTIVAEEHKEGSQRIGSPTRVKC